MWFNERHSGGHEALFAILMVIAPLPALLDHILTYWELEPRGFCEHRL
jgi:hypothetical protein